MLNAELNAERDLLNAELNAREPVEAELSASFRLHTELNAERHFSLNDSYSGIMVMIFTFSDF